LKELARSERLERPTLRFEV